MGSSETDSEGFIVSDGKMVLRLTPEPEGGYTVTSPMYPGLVTEAETLEEAFFMARDALACLEEAWEILHKRKASKAKAS